MPEPIKIRRALISVYDKTGIVEFARALHDEFGVEIISTGGTAKALTEAGIPVTLVEGITGFPEMLDGRVKTLHPKIHAAILADRDNPEHMRQLKEQGIEPIDMVVVNLYPFKETVADPNCKFEDAIEMIDIGGPCLLRAAAKNHRHVLVVSEADEVVYEKMVGYIKEWDRSVPGDDLHRRNAWNAFWQAARYDAAIATWLSRDVVGYPAELRALHMRSWGRLRYGENPHQDGELLQLLPETEGSDLTLAGALWEAHREPSFNNYADASAALELCADLTRSSRFRTANLRFADAKADGDPDARSGDANAPEAANRRSAVRVDRGPEPDVHRHARTPAVASRRQFRPTNDETTVRRKLPHWQVPGATYWITFRSVIGELSDSERRIAFEAVRYWDGQRLDLHALAVMPDHVHALLTPRQHPGKPDSCFHLGELLKSIKGFSGREISQARGGVGQVWDTETYDHWIRDSAEFEQKWRYIAENPVKEGLAPTPQAYAWWYGVDCLGLGIGVPPGPDTPVPPILGGPYCKPPVRTPDSGKPEVCDTGSAVGMVGEPDDRTPEFYHADVRKPEVCDTVKRTTPAACFIKHTNACGVGTADDPIEAYRRAYLGDPNAAMGGILAVNFNVQAAFAEAVMESLQRWGKDAGAGAFFVEVWVAPSFDEEAVKIIRTKKKWGERVRLLAVGDMNIPRDPDEVDVKKIAGGMLVQTPDLVGLNEDKWKVATKREPTERELGDLRLAWLIAKHTKSNAISICKDGMLIGNGAGQMSRVMSCRIATWLAKDNGHDMSGAAAASDAFFPFRDGPDILADAGVTAIIQPGGSKRDQEVIDACNERNVTMIFTGTRHFKH